MEKPNKRSREQSSNLSRNDLVDIIFTCDTVQCGVSVTTLRSMLCEQLRHNFSKRYAAALQKNHIHIFEGTTWDQIQTIDVERFLPINELWFISPYELLICLDGKLKIWNIRCQMFTKTIIADIDTNSSNFVVANKLVQYKSHDVFVLSTESEQVTKLKHQDFVSHACANDKELIALDCGDLVFWNVDTMEKVREISSKIPNINFICPWFGNNVVISTSKARVFNIDTGAIDLLARSIIYSKKYGNKIIAALNNSNEISVWSENCEYESFPIEVDDFLFHNPFGVIGSKLFFLQMPEDDGANNIRIFDIETKRQVKEIKGEFTLVHTW
jgi:hypothetical protein